MLSYGMFAWTIAFTTMLFFVLSPSCAILPKKSPEKYVEVGKKYSAKKNYAKAYKNYTKAIEGDAFLFVAYWERALVEIKMDSLEKAIDDIGMYIAYMRGQESMEGKQLLEKAFLQRATILMKKGYKSDACTDWEDACSLNISNTPCEQYRLNCK